MTTAFEKNKDAIKSLTGNETASTLTQTCKIGVWSEGSSLKSGELIAKSLGDFLGRFWRNIDATGVYADLVIDCAKISSKSCQFDSTIEHQWNPPYDFVIGIGSKFPSDSPGLSIGANGWKVNSGMHVSLSDDPNPVGPFFASALSAAQVFKSIFQEFLPEGSTKELPQDFIWNSWYGNNSNELNVSDLDFNEFHVFGVGAVSHGFFWILQNWPGKIVGTIHLIDPDNYDESNPQRYLGTTLEDIGNSKTETMKVKLERIHPKLTIISHKLDMNSYFEHKNPQCMIKLGLCGLDSEDGRRQLALKLPKKIINMWTSNYHVGASQFSFDDNWPCLYCAYPESKEKIPDETGMIYKELQLPPPRIRELLFSGEGINESDALIIGRKLGVDPKSIMNKPLRSVRGQMCSTGKIMSQQNTNETTVPLVFASGIAGIVGFIETLKEIKSIDSKPSQWQMAILKYPTEYSWSVRDKNPDCYLCSDEKIPEIIQKKYYDME